MQPLLLPNPPRPAYRGSLRPHEPFDLTFGPVHRRVDRFAGLRALGDHLHDRRLGPHLGPDFERRRITRNAGDYVTARRIIVNRALGRLYFFPDLEILHIDVGRNVETDARRDQLFLAFARRQVSQEALCRRNILGEVPDPPVIVAAIVEPAFGAFRRRERPALLGDFDIVASGDRIALGALKINALCPEISALLFEALSYAKTLSGKVLASF